jgi:cellulose synthase/poly-beta-1,6-N-acetylglucosamine synthase-like glycosyltransferase
MTFNSAVSLVMPVHGAWESCRPALTALRALQPAPLEVILVADGAVSGSCDLEMSVPLTVLSTGVGSRKGPGATRNLGAAAARGDLLLFVDSDVVVPSHVLEQVAKAFSDYPAASAVFGSYDAEAGAPNFLSQYKNLFHHFVHQTAPSEVATFWTGCGAIRAEVFRATGGFHESEKHLEDVELGFRLRRQGHSIRLCKSIQVKHLKRYGVASLLRSDIVSRALPWSRIILDAGSWPNEVNLQQGQAGSAVLLAIFLVLLAGGVAYPPLAWLAPLPLAALTFRNRLFYLFLARNRGASFALLSILWHWLYFGYAAVAFGWVWCDHALSLLRRRQARSLRRKIVSPLTSN